ncbi:unnamed protein product [Clonostachys rosea]|uniref:Zn(2)-C6 fungal-type domain-containing protein n=1 Tax=Bionectria ochroleuca TaxID=29856 RepID=A0ABY6U6D5_BIOOC|nr:unnamed protein product [Clonostachys rosea]
MQNRNPKACEPCRRRKIRCDGKTPCAQCRDEPASCSYRTKIRTRASLRPFAASARSDSHRTSPVAPTSQPRIPRRDLDPVQERGTSQSPYEAPATRTSIQEPTPRLYESVAVAHLAPQLTDSSQLFYGPSSSFAFIQQVYRLIRAKVPLTASSDNGQEGNRSALDLFKQRNVFFGVPWRSDPLASSLYGSQGISALAAKQLAGSLLAVFQAGSYPFFPFSTPSSLENLLDSAYDDWTAITSLKKSYLLLMLAIGALQTTDHAELADRIFIEAKREAVLYEDAVNIPAIQLSLLMADYQINMGRPNSAYLHVGNACRKGMALGLAHITGGYTQAQTQERSATLWSLYYHETRI